jgi:hypothetical protein
LRPRNAAEQRIDGERRGVERLSARQRQPPLDAELVGMIDHKHRFAGEASSLEMLSNSDGVFLAAYPCDEDVIRGGSAERRRQRLKRAG